MKEVTQTIQSGHKANCYAACVASIFEINIDLLPILPDDDIVQNAHKCSTPETCGYTIQEKRSEYWWGMWDRFYAANNLLPIRFKYESFYPNERERLFKDSWHIISGRSPRDKEGTERHAVVGRNGVIWFDPFPSREGLISMEEIELIVPRDPAKPILKAYEGV